MHQALISLYEKEYDPENGFWASHIQILAAHPKLQFFDFKYFYAILLILGI